MRAFTKRIIWFFGFGIFDMLNELSFWIRNDLTLKEAYPDIYMFQSFIILGIWCIPLLFIKDDKK